MTSLPHSDLWESWRVDGDRQAREKLILKYTPLVLRVVNKMKRGLPAHADFEDLQTYGVIGLIRAVDNFNPYAGVQFETYAVPSIRGGILDELRALDWAPRSLRKRQREIAKASYLLEIALGRPPSDWQIAEKLGLEVKTVQETRRLTVTSQVKSLDEQLGVASSDHTFNLTDVAPSPDDLHSVQFVHELVTEFIVKANPLEQLLLSLYYYEGLTLAQVGQVLGIPESRVSRVHTRLMLELRSKLLTILQDGEQP